MGGARAPTAAQREGPKTARGEKPPAGLGRHHLAARRRPSAAGSAEHDRQPEGEPGTTRCKPDWLCPTGIINMQHRILAMASVC